MSLTTQDLETLRRGHGAIARIAGELLRRDPHQYALPRRIFTPGLAERLEAAAPSREAVARWQANESRFRELVRIAPSGWWAAMEFAFSSHILEHAACDGCHRLAILESGDDGALCPACLRSELAACCLRPFPQALLTDEGRHCPACVAAGLAGEHDLLEVGR